MTIDLLWEILGAVGGLLLSALLGAIIKAVKNGKAKKALQAAKDALDTEMAVDVAIKEAVAYAEKLGGTPAEKLANALECVHWWAAKYNLLLDDAAITTSIEELVAYTKTVNAPSTSTAKIVLELDDNEAEHLKNFLTREGGHNRENTTTE